MFNLYKTNIHQPKPQFLCLPLPEFLIIRNKKKHPSTVCRKIYQDNYKAYFFSTNLPIKITNHNKNKNELIKSKIIPIQNNTKNTKLTKTQFFSHAAQTTQPNTHDQQIPNSQILIDPHFECISTRVVEAFTRGSNPALKIYP